MLILIGIGVVMIYSASSIPMWQSTGESASLLKKQILYLAIGFLGLCPRRHPITKLPDYPITKSLSPAGRVVYSSGLYVRRLSLY